MAVRNVPPMGSGNMVTPPAPAAPPLPGVGGIGQAGMLPAPMSPVSRAFQQGYQQGITKPPAAPKARAATPKRKTAAKAPKPAVSQGIIKGLVGKAVAKEAQPKTLMGKIGAALKNNKANIQKKAVDRMKASGRKG